jgi:uncharacterized protein
MKSVAIVEIARGEFTMRGGSVIEFAIAEFARNALCESEGGASTDQHKVCGAVHSVAEFVRQESDRRERKVKDRRAIACQAGCSHCCHMRVVATVPELIAVANFMALNFSGEETDAARQRVIEGDGRTRGLTDEQWGIGHFACPLLVDDKCSVYAARPLECRGYNSFDVGACGAAARDYLGWDVPMDDALMGAFKSAQAGLLQAVASGGHPPRLVELTAALRVIFEDPLAIERWLGGEDAFVEAQLDLSDPEQRAFLPWVPSDELRAADEQKLET